MRGDVEFVLQKPENWYPHADGRITLVRDYGYNQIPGVRVDFRFDHDGTVRIASVYRMNRRSIAKKMQEKKKAIEALSQTGYARSGGEVPGWLSVADYLRATRKVEDNRSWPPSSPSGEPLKASTANGRIQGHAPVDVNQHRVDEMGESDREQAPLVAELVGDEVLSLHNDPVKAAIAYYRNNLQGKTIPSPIGDVRFTRKGSYKVKQRVHRGQADAGLVPAIPAIISKGEYLGRRELYKQRNDDIVAFHEFRGHVRLDGKNHVVRVFVGEDRFGNLFYDLQQRAAYELHQGKESLAARSRSSGRNIDDYSLNVKVERTDSVAHTLGVNQHRAHLRRAFGKAAETLERSGKLKIVASDAESLDHPMVSDAQAAYDPKSGTVYLMAGNVRPEDAPSVVAHEFMHDFTMQGGGRALLDDLAAMEARAKSGSPLARWFEEARSRVPEDTPEEHRLHEIAAYAVQRVIAGREKLGSIRKWVSRLLAKVKAWLVRMKFPLAHLDGDALAEMAIRHLKETARRARQAAKDEANPKLFSRAEEFRKVLARELPDNLDEAVTHTSLAALKGKEGTAHRRAYEAAKTGGDDAAAVDVVDAVFKPERAREIARMLDPDKPVFVLPVLQREGARWNRLPEWFAHRLAREIGAKLAGGIVRVEGKHNTGAAQTARMLNRIAFDGRVPDPKGQYVIADDNYTSGATIMALIDHLVAQGVKLENIVVTTLAASRYGRGLRPKPGRIDALLADTGLRESEIGSIIGHDVGGLTDAEINLIRTSTRKGGATGLRKLFGEGGDHRGSAELAGEHEPHRNGEGDASGGDRLLDDTPLYSRKPGGNRHGNQHPNANPFERFDKKSLLTGMKEAAKGHAASAATIGYTIGRAFYFSMR